LEDDVCAPFTPIRSKSGYEFPLVAAIQYGCCQGVLRLLIQAGADVNETGSAGLSPLATLASCPLKEPLRATHGLPSLPCLWLPLLPLPGEAPSAPQDHSVSGWGNMDSSAPPWVLRTAASAASLDSESCSKAIMLLRAGADLRSLDSKGHTASDIARASKQPKLTLLLENWLDWQQSNILRAHWRRAPGASLRSDGTCLHLLQLPAEVYNLICDFTSVGVCQKADHC